MDNTTEFEELRHRFALKLAELLEQKKIGTQDAGKIILDFNELLGKKSKDEIQEFIDHM